MKALALDHAANGWHVLPVDASTKRAYISDWPNLATTDEHQVELWWTTWPDAVPGIVPGRSGKTCVDVDEHEGKSSGFVSIDQAGVEFAEGTHVCDSMSGNGLHIWFEGVTRTVEGILPGVDLRSVGGYAIEVGIMPHVDAVSAQLPSMFVLSVGGGRGDDYDGALLDWLADHSGEISAEVQAVLDEYPEPFRGHDRLLDATKKMVSRGAAGCSGATEGLIELEARWLSTPHQPNKDLPGEEFDSALAGAVRRYANTPWLALSVEEAADLAHHLISMKPTAPEHAMPRPLATTDDLLSGLPEGVQKQLARLLETDLAKRALAELKAREQFEAWGDNGPRIERFAAAVRKPREAKPFAIADVLPLNGHVLADAQYKAGKTLLSGNVAKSLVDGTALFGRFPVHAVSRVGFVNFEVDDDDLTDYLEPLGIRNSNALWTLGARGWARRFDLRDDRVRDYWGRRFEEAGTDVLILDPLGPVLSALAIDTNDNDGVRRYLDAMTALAAEYGVRNVLVNVHQGHGGERARGASAFNDWADMLWHYNFARDGEGNRRRTGPRYFSAEGRRPSVPEFEVAFDAVTGLLTVGGGSREDAKALDLLNQIIEWLVEQPSKRNTTEIRKAITGDSNDFTAALGMGLESGRLASEKGERRTVFYTVPGVSYGLRAG